MGLGAYFIVMVINMYFWSFVCERKRNVQLDVMAFPADVLINKDRE